jgi:hypothetical protein
MQLCGCSEQLEEPVRLVESTCARSPIHGAARGAAWSRMPEAAEFANASVARSGLRTATLTGPRARRVASYSAIPHALVSDFMRWKYAKHLCESVQPSPTEIGCSAATALYRRVICIEYSLRR